MRKKYKRLKLIELSDIHNLENVIELFARDYNKDIQYLREHDISLIDKVLRNKWRKRDGDFNISEFRKNDKVVRYLKANAFIEIAATEREAVIEGVVLPRGNRVKGYEYPVLFFENDNKVYCVLRCAEYMDIKIKSNLMGAGRSKGELSEVWGSINDSEIDNYMFNSNLFYWLIKKDGKELEIGKENITINSIKSLTHSSLRGDTIYSSEGEDLLSETVTKTTLGIDSNVDTVGVTVEQEDGTFDIVLDKSGTCGIDDVSSILLREGGHVEFIDNYIDEVIIRIYCCIIPIFKELYRHEVESKEWTEDTLQICKREWALEVINDLCYDNEITQQDILALDCFIKD